MSQRRCEATGSPPPFAKLAAKVDSQKTGAKGPLSQDSFERTELILNNPIQAAPFFATRLSALLQRLRLEMSSTEFLSWSDQLTRTLKHAGSEAFLGFVWTQLRAKPKRINQDRRNRPSRNRSRWVVVWVPPDTAQFARVLGLPPATCAREVRCLDQPIDLEGLEVLKPEEVQMLQEWGWKGRVRAGGRVLARGGRILVGAVMCGSCSGPFPWPVGWLWADAEGWKKTQMVRGSQNLKDSGGRTLEPPGFSSAAQYP